MVLNSITQLLKLIYFQPLIIPFILFLFYLYKWQKRTKNFQENLPPSPPKLPILGNIHQLSTRPHYSLRSLSDQYGDLMLLHLGSMPALIVSSARAAREITVTHDVIFASRPKSKKAKKLFYGYKNVGTAPYGEYWRQMKSICVQHLLNNKTVRSFRRERQEEITLVTEKITKLTPYSPVDLSELFRDFTNDMICKVVFGRKCSEKDDGINFNKFVKEFTGSLAEFCFGDYFPWLAWIDRLRGWDAKVDKMFIDFNKFVEKMVKEHHDHLDNCRMAEDGDDNEKVKDFLDVLIGIQKDQTAALPIDHVCIKAIILDMISAGTDTTSSLLEWAMAELLKHPEVMKKLQNEVRGITGEELYVKEEDLEQMKYLNAVIKETLRLHPTVPLLAPHESSQDIKINGYHIPAKTTVLINAWAIHRDPDYWDEPEKFNPERFLNSPTDYRGQDLQFIPFGAGRRICPGISFAMASSELLLANLMLKFDWTLPDGIGIETLDMSDCFTISLQKKIPLLAIAIAHTTR